jgi:phage-related protein
LKKNPALVNDSAYLSSHPELQNFLSAHPGVREEIREKPRVFMNRERQFDKSGRDITRQELQNLDNFLDTHPNIEQDLKKNPKLLNDSAYLSAHPELKQFLDTHPGVRAEASENPRIFMNRERRFENSGRDIPTAEARSFDNFLDNHSSIERQLRKEPSLANNTGYLAKHPELKGYLDQHPLIRQELAEHPRAVLRAERRIDKKESAQAKAERREERIERSETRSRR